MYVFDDMFKSTFRRIVLFVGLVAVICATKVSTAHRLNVPRVLLPVFNNFAVNFTLEVTDSGCYKWSTSRLDIIQLIPINENFDRTCSSALLIQTITRELTRNTAIVLAEDINTGHFLRCDVIVDAIFSLNLTTTTRELYIEDIPEAFEVRAYDEQGNQFTTLAGIEFLWTIGDADKRAPSDIKSTSNVLRFMTYEESQYERPVSVAALDSIGKRGHIVLIEGVRTGTAKVSVRLPHSEYKHVPSIELELIVIANLIIIPPEITIMAYDSFKYKIMHTRQGRLEEISLPSSQYYLEAENSDILEIDNDHDFAYGRKTGRTKVFLHDKNVREEYPVILPSAIVNIHEVAYISLSVLPNRNWGLILDHSHEIIVELYDSKDHKFHVGEGVEVSMKIDEQYLEPKLITQNGTYAVVVPITCGMTIVEATLRGIIDKRGKKIPFVPQLSTKAELTVHTPVKVQPRVLTIPWDVVNKSKFDIMLKANGGDGSYVWSNRQPSTVAVSQTGGIRILSAGIAEVVVAMARNQYNKDTAKIYVLSPSRLKIIEYNMEAALGEPIHLHVALFGRLINGSDVKEIPFSDCKDIDFAVHISDKNFVQSYDKNVQPVGAACAVLTITNYRSVGTFDVIVAYSVNDNNAIDEYLSDNVTVSAHEPLTAIHPESKETLLVVGSSRNVIFKGGPLPWTNKSQDYSREVRLSNEQIAEVVEYEDSMNRQFDRAVFKVICKALGATALTYTVSNVPLFPNCRRSYASETVDIVCGKPRYIYLQPEFKDGKNCPISQNTNKVIAHSDKRLKISVIVKDEDGRRFDNITSLNIEWNLKPSGSGIVEIPSSTIEETETDMNIILPKSHYQNIIFKKHHGTLMIYTTVTGYQKQVLNRLKIVPEWPPFPIENERGGVETPLIEASIETTLVNDTVVNPDNLMILNDSNMKSYLQVSQGSGYYEFILSSDVIADVRYMDTTRMISVTPRKPGVLHITLVDLCLPSKSAEVRVEVQQLAAIEVDTVNKIEKGKCVTALLRLCDTNGHIVKLPSLGAVDFRAEIDNEYVEIKQLPADEQGAAPYERTLYKIYGVSEGESQLTFTKKGDHEIRSEPITVQVFVPLRVQPRNLTILIGTIYQMQTIGGPPNAEIEFATESGDVLRVDRNGILEGKSAGRTKIRVRAVGLDAKGNKVIYSEDRADIHVLHLEGVKILTPVNRVKMGATFPLWAFGVPDYLTPLIIGSMQLPLSFAWSSSDPGLLTLHNMYEGTGINIRYQNQVSLRARAVSPGVATIYLNVTVPCNMLSGFSKNDITYTTFVKIEIFEELSLINPVTSGESVVPILMSPNSILQLQTNRDKHGATTYKVLSSTHGNEPEDAHALTPAAKTVTVDKSGIVRSGENIGQTVISVVNTEAYSLKQSLTVVVEVKPIHYMMLSLKSRLRIRSGEELNMLPKGMELDYVVDYYDNVGNKFHAAETNVKAMLNRADLASFTTNSDNIITAKFLENGELVVKAFNERYPNTMFDYVYMMIGDIVFPTKTTLTVGDVICFSMPLLSSDGDPGYWQSSAPEILSVDPITGIGRARNVGNAVIKHSLATHVQSEIEVNILPISRVSIVPLRGKNITGTETFSVPLVLKSKEEEIKENNVLARGLGGCRTLSSFALNAFPYTCNIQFVSSASLIAVKDLFLVKPRFDIVTGFYYCDITPMSPSNVVASTIESHIQISAQSRDIESAALELTFLPPMYIDTKEIIFVATQGTVPSVTFEVYGVPSVLQHLTINVPDGVAITWQQYLSKPIMQCRLRLIHNQDEIQGQKIYIANDLTKQNISLHIRISRNIHFIPVSGVQWVNYVYFHRYILGIFAVIVITIFYLWKYKVVNVFLTVKNRDVFADKSPLMMRRAICTPNTSRTSSSPRTPLTSPLRPFSAFETPIYGDPRCFGTPYLRRRELERRE
ncbi:nuclear pore membrane glycoprotein 210 [Linepithema humile]|uniref:nuclear pore membrane glycoprotein 210 n=1 Tax=Linepithema humile TaxID=83485 RepID=UPI0006233533|nr:PREDICTED: nuclear pore membrane glycoprotein 210 [Linepithema humile]